MSASRPNVLWIMTDQHRADAVGYMGNDVIQTPHLDRLAAGAVVFEHAYCQSPVCMASRGSVFTGRYPQAIGIRGMGLLPPAETTFPEVLRRRDYRTGAFGKVHLTPQQYTRQQLQSEYPTLDWRRFIGDAAIGDIPDDPVKTNYGFEEYVGDEDALRGPFHDWLRREAPALRDAGPGQRFEGGPADLFVSPYPSSHHPTTFVARCAAEFIERQAQPAPGQPWMAFCSFVAPHHPFAAPADQIARYPLGDVPLPAAKGGVDIDRSRICARLAEAIDESRLYSEEIQRRMVQHYYASISLIDDGVGLVLDTLRRTGQFENTIVVFVADHGEFLGHHGLWRKPSFHYDDTVRVPLLLAGGGLAPRRETGLVELVDLCPTLLSLLDLPAPPGVQGRDWSRALRERQTVGREDIYSDMYDMDPMVFGKAGGPYAACLTVRSEAWKLNVYPDVATPCGQLFDLRSDPDETTNLFDAPAHRERRDEMMWRLMTRMHAQVDPLPLRLTQW